MLVGLLGCSTHDGLAPVGPDDPLVRALLAPEPAVRRQAVRRVLEIGADPELLVETLWDPDSRVRGEARHALARLGPPAVPHLARTLADGELVLMRRRAAEVLGDIGPQAGAAAPALAHALSADDALVRYEAATALSRMGRAARPAVLALGAALARDPSPAVRLRAAEALGQAGDVEAWTVLGLALRRDRSPGVRERAATAIGALRGPGHEAALATAASDDPDARVRAAAARALGE